MPTYLKGAKGSQLLVKLQTSLPGVTPITYGHPCSINAEREFALEANINESEVIDCDDPEAPSWVTRTVQSLSGTVTGGGRHNTADWSAWWDWFISGETRRCQVVTNVAAEDGGDITEGEFVLANLSKSGARGGEVESAMTLQSSGPLVRSEVE